jgi:hypothetical protein
MKFPRLILALLFVAACQPVPSAQQAAEHFLDAHYVRMDLVRSHSLASGVAQSKIEREIDLVAEFSGEEKPPLPHVHYSLESVRDGEGMKTFQYSLRIQAQGAATALQKEVLLTLREDESGNWGVTNFSDSDALSSP